MARVTLTPPNPGDYTRPVTVTTFPVADGVVYDVVLDARLIGVVEQDGGNALVFVQEGVSEPFNAANNDFDKQVQDYVTQATAAGVTVLSLADVEAFANGEYEVDEQDDSAIITELFGSDDDE